MNYLKEKYLELCENIFDSHILNSSFLFFSSLLSNLLGFAFWLIITHFYSSNEIGLATGIISSSEIIVSFSNLGLGFGIIRYLSIKDEKKNSLINTSLITVGFLSVILTIGFLLIELFSKKILNVLFENWFITILFIIFNIIYSLFYIYGQVFIGFRTSKYYFYQNILYFFLRIPIAFLLITWGILGIIFSNTISILVSFIISGIIYIPKIFQKYVFIFKIDKEILQRTLPFSFGNYIAVNLGSLPGQLAPLLLINTIGSDNAAYFYTANAFASILLFPINAISTSLFAEGSNNEIDITDKIYQSIKIIFTLLFFGIIGFFLFSNTILSLYGEEYAINGSILLCFLSISSVPIVIINLYITINRIKNNIKAIIFINFSILFFFLIFGFTLIEKYGLIGIGIAWILGNSIVSICILFYYKNEIIRYLKNLNIRNKCKIIST